MAFDSFVKIKDIEGEAIAVGFEKQMEIQSFSFGAQNSAEVGPGRGGLSSGRVSLSDFSFMKETDKASTKLFQHCCTGETIPEVIVSICKATGKGKQQAFLKYTFSQVMISSIQWSGSSGGGDTPSEAVSMTYGKIEIEYNVQDEKGNLSKGGMAAWDQQKQTA